MRDDVDSVKGPEAVIVVIDDGPVITRLLGGMLATTGKVHTANSGTEGLALAKRVLPDLILLDVQMPGLDGFDVISELRGDPSLRHVPVIFITAEVLPEIESHCLEAGGADYIAKPVTTRVLLARARTHLLLKEQADMLAERSYRDPMTGVLNVGVFEEVLESECARAADKGRSVALLLVEVDELAAYNKVYGFHAGDEVLGSVAGIAMARANRPGDAVARIAGGLFAVILPETSAQDAGVIADAICAGVRALEVRHKDSPAHGVVTVSVGVAQAHSGWTSHQLMQSAESALRLSQRVGGNRVNFA